MLINTHRLLANDVATVFNGYCRYGSDSKDTFKSIDSDDVEECKRQCVATPNCVAYAYRENYGGKDCDLYRGGPYTYGNGRADIRCYILKRGYRVITHTSNLSIRN